MTSHTWAGADPVDGIPPADPAAPTGRAPAPPAAAEKSNRWADLDGAVRSIGEQALKMNLRRAADLETAVGLARRGELDDGRRLSAVEAAHQLAGSAGTFGFPGASDRAAELERFFVRAVFEESQLLQAADQVAALFAELATEPDF